MKIEKTERIRMAYGVIRDETEALISEKEMWYARYRRLIDLNREMFKGDVPGKAAWCVDEIQKILLEEP
jgi:hypothetical protein